MRFPGVTLRLPAWVEDLLAEEDRIYPTVEDRMRLAVALSRSNIQHRTGGPFGAAIFERETGRLLAPGVNLVTSLDCSVFHAEMVAIMVAQGIVGNRDLGGPGQAPYELVASTQPCAMCLGATLWSGVGHLVCGARDDDAEEIGFDEGMKPADWVGSLEERGISVERDVLRDEAASVLREYAEGGGEIYNARQGGL
jgi:tRNA(Arg) A34 adenosine deaminase TadA